jgi:hypothetical protein
MPIEKYKYLKVNESDSLKFNKAYKKSKNDFEIDFKTGNFSGIFDGKTFTGNFEIKKITSGFVKGFNYAVELGGLVYDATETKEQEWFFSHLASTKRVFISPQTSNLILLELKNEDKSVKLYMKKD